jgi:hypothetical protein
VARMHHGGAHAICGGLRGQSWTLDRRLLFSMAARSRSSQLLGARQSDVGSYLRLSPCPPPAKHLTFQGSRLRGPRAVDKNYER